MNKKKGKKQQSIFNGLSLKSFDNQGLIFSAIINQTHDGIAVSDLKGKLFFVNHTFLEMHGFTLDEVIGKHLSIFHSEDQLPMVEAANKELLKNGSFEGEIWHRRKDGTIFPTLMNNSILKDENGNAIGLIGTMIDISVHKNTYDELKEKDAFLKDIFNSIQDAICVMDTELNILLTNHYPEKWYINKMPIVGEKCYEVFHDRKEPCEICPSIRTLKSGNPDFEVIQLKWEGSTYFFETYSFPFYKQKTRELSGVIEYVRNITNRKQLEEKLRESEQKLRRIFHFTKEGIISTDQNGIIMLANSAVAEILGYSKPEELIGMKGIELYAYPEQRNKVFKSLVKNGVIKDLELTFKKKDGTLVYIKGSAAVHLDEKGNILQTDGIFRDVTSEKENEERLREIKEKFRLITEAISEVFWISDISTNKTFYVSPAYEKIWGCSCESLYKNPRSFLDAIHPEDRVRIINTVNAKEYGQPFKHEYRIIHTDGSIRWIWDQGYPIYDDSGQIASYVGIAQNITEKKEFESKMKLQGEITKNVKQGIVLVRTSDNRIIYTNQKMNELFGYEPDELIEKDVSILNASTEKSSDEIAQEITRRLRKHGVWDGEALCRRKDGTVFWCQASITRFHDPILGELWIGINKDITEKKQTLDNLKKREEELESKTAELEELNAALNILLQKREEDRRVFEEDIIFNIKELIMPYLARLMNSSLNKKQKTYIEIIESHINEILSPFSFRINSGYHDLTPTEINVATLIKQGRKTKEIATLMNSSERAIEFHRNSLRRKFGLKNKKANLRTFLLSLR